jgi:hypothetical protein
MALSPWLAEWFVLERIRRTGIALDQELREIALALPNALHLDGHGVQCLRYLLRFEPRKPVFQFLPRYDVCATGELLPQSKALCAETEQNGQ